MPKLILAPLAIATHWNVLVELWLSFAVAVAGYIGLLRLMRRDDFGPLLVSSLAYFSLAAYENWLWGWQFSWFLTNTLFIWAVVALASNKNVAIAALLCTLATFSSAYGIVSWIALAPFLIKRRAIFIWVALFAANLAAYLYQFHPRQGQFARDAIGSILYALTLLGSPLARITILAAILGAALLAFFAVAAWRQRDNAWIAIGLFAIGFAAMNAIGRGALGVSWALSSRYLTPASLLLIAAVNLNARRLVLIAVFAAVVAQSVTSIPIGVQIKRGRDEAAICVQLLLVNDSPDCIPSIAESAEMLRRNTLAVHRVGVRPLVTESDFVMTRVKPPSRGLFAIVGTVRGTRRIVAASVVRDRSTPWRIVFPPRLVQRYHAFELWLFVPRDRKLYRLEERVL